MLGAFDGFVFNSPFLGWGWDVGPIERFFISCAPPRPQPSARRLAARRLRAVCDRLSPPSRGRYAPSLLMALRVWTASTELTAAGGPNSWGLQYYSQYEFDPASRPLYLVPVTAGFCRAINRAHWLLRSTGRAGVPVTLKPFLVMASKMDDVLKGNETLRAAHAIGPSRTLLELAYARHDVFCSAEAEVVRAALAHLSAWLEGEGLSC
jgi:alpha-beta hydrolase superfamily lysophospholipase